MDPIGEFMDQKTSWLSCDGWWRKEDWPFELKFTEETERIVNGNHCSELQLRDVVQNITHVRRCRSLGGGFGPGVSHAQSLARLLFDAILGAILQGKPSQLQHISVRTVIQHGYVQNADYYYPDDTPLSSRTQAVYGPGHGGGQSHDFTILAELIERGRLQALKHLELSRGDGHSRLADAMSSAGLPSLETLSFRHVYLTFDEWAKYEKALKSGKLPKLTYLDLSHSEQTHVLPDSLFCSSFRFPSLRYLDVSGTELGNQGAEYLSKAIRSRALTKLTELKLFCTGISNEGLDALVGSFQKGKAWLLPTLSSLDLGRNSFTDVGLLSLANALNSRKLPKLSTLHVSANNGVIEKYSKVSRKLTVFPAIELSSAALELSSDDVAAEGLIGLADSFQKSVPSLSGSSSSPDLRAISRTETGLLLLIEAVSLGNLPNLHCLTAKNIRSKGIKSLEVAIRSGNFKNLTELQISSNESNRHDRKVEATEPNLLSLLGALSSSRLPNLSCLKLGDNSFGNEGTKSFEPAILSSEWKNLAELDLSSNDIGDAGLIDLAKTFEKNAVKLLPNLRFLKLSDNSFGELGMLSLVDALTSGSLDSLRVLDVRNCLSSSREKVATALVSAYFRNPCLTVDVKFEWFSLPELDRRRQELIQRNSSFKDILAKLGTVPKVQATFAKVYICGNPNVGKTTLRRTLQRSFWKSLFMWERRPVHERQTRGIDVSQVSSKRNNADEDPITLLVWDMAGQEDFHLVHNAFFPDLGLAEGKATTFIVVCSSNSSLQQSKEQLQYWLRYIASSCDKSIENPRHVFIVMNNIGGDQKIREHPEDWKEVLAEERDRFENLKIQTDLFLLDAREFQQVKDLKSRLLQHSRNLLRNQEVPEICHIIQENLSVWSRAREQFPVLQWAEFVTEVHRQRESWPEHIIEAATKYLNEAGVLIYLHDEGSDEGVRLLVLDPNWLCREIIGKVFLPRDMASSRELLFREQVDKSTGSISVSEFKKFFKSLKGEWNDAQVDDLIALLLWLGLCYKGRDHFMFIPGLIAENGTPGDAWYSRIPVEHGADQWVMGFSVMHRKNEVALAPISLWHRFQVDLAQSFKFDSHMPDNDFVAGKYFMTFVVNYLKVLIEVDANPNKPTFQEISIQVKPKFDSDELDGTERKQSQVDLASDLVERLLTLWNQVCPAVQYVQKVIWPWPASLSRSQTNPDRNVEVAEVKRWVQERGVGRKMQWDVGPGSAITEGQLLSTKDQREVAQSVEHTLSIVTQGIKDAVKLKIFPADVLNDEVFVDDSVLASNGIHMPASSTVEEQDEVYSKLSTLLSKKLKPIDNKVDKLYKKVENVEQLLRDGFGEVLQKQKQLLHKLQDTDRMFLEDRESICPKFIYLGTPDSAWVTLKDALSLSTTVRLRFACEAHYNNYRPHIDVRNQQGLLVSQLTDWGRAVLPWLRVSLTVLFISAKVAANVVAPGVGLIIPDFVSWQQVSSLSEGIAEATGFSKDQLEKMVERPELTGSDAYGDPQALYKKSRKAIAELLEGLNAKEFQEQIGLRKVALKYPDGTLHGVAWICGECCEKFPIGTVSEL